MSLGEKTTPWNGKSTPKQGFNLLKQDFYVFQIKNWILLIFLQRPPRFGGPRKITFQNFNVTLKDSFCEFIFYVLISLLCNSVV